MPTLVVLAGLAVLAGLVADLSTDVWWYDSVGFRGVFVTELTTKTLIFAVAGLLTAGAVGASLVVAYRTRPIYVPVTPAQQVLEQYRQAIEPLRRIALVVIPVVLGLLAGSGSMGAWRTYLLWANGGDFGTKDPQFGLDVGFFVFTLPWLDFIVSFVTVVLVLAFLAAAFTHYVYGGLQLPGRGPSTRAAYVHLGVLGALIALTRAASYWLDRYSLSTQKGSLITGITYTDANAVLPTKAILAVAAVMCAGFFLAAIWSRSWRLPITGVALLVVTAVVVGAVYPALIQSLKVGPSEKSLEAKYIGRNIAATSAAFGLDRVERIQNVVPAQAPATAALRAGAEDIPGVRIIDPNVVAPTFRQLEGQRDYYAFPDTLDVDRYTVDQRVDDAVVAVREINLDGLPDNQRNWINDHTVFTHGYGFYAAYGNQRTTEGDPVFFEGGGRSTLGPYEPRIYFGELSPEYSVVGAERGASPREFDYPGGSDGDVAVQNTYTGGGGVSIGSFMRRVAYAIKYREANFLLSDAVNGQSRILDHRTPKERVERVAPWLQLDGNAYPAVVDGRVQWIVDGFTTSASYPNSRLVDLAEATSDSVARRSNVVQVRTGEINYIRNAVKATVDAEDGSVRLYGWDVSDPILKAWSKAFPGSVRPLSDISGSLMSHIRYPQDLIKVQRDLLNEYHVTDPGTFYSGSDKWRVPRDPSVASQDQPVLFQSIALPGEKAATFSITTSFVPASNNEAGREILRGLLAVNADAGTQAGKPAASFGALRLLEFGAAQPPGPGQVRNQIQNSTSRSQNPAEPLNLAQYITNNSGSGKQLTFGNLLTFPLAGRTFYVQPIYVQASSGSGSFPQNKITVALYGTNVAWGDTLEQAITGLFGQGSGGGGGGGSPTTPTTPSTPSTSLEQQLTVAIGEIQAAYSAGQQALTKGDFAAYGDAQKALAEAITKADSIAAQLGAPAATPAPSATPSAAPSASTTASAG
ncbi:UPF0182 family protein [Phycicoccus duodecadis]|uniref:UPF0182 family membrane protein n=1 Tax=Phycicoccus duodecadis TaxID=173053 RepID=UPI001FE63DEC|nr:UPF0182 family protein [Phycicoccus duodecadis]